MSRLVSRVFAAALLAGALPLVGCGANPSARVSGEAGSLNRAQVELFMAALKEAPSHGFRPGAFGEARLAEQLERDPRGSRAAVRQAMVRYANALHGHAIPKKAFARDWLRPAAYDAEAELVRAAQAGQLEDWVKALPPSSAQYQSLRAAYAQYARIAQAGGWSPLPFDDDLKAGARGSQVVALRDRLAVEDPAARRAAADGVFDPALVEAVKRAQLRYGLHATGDVDDDTRAALDLPVEMRLAQIRANLERLRWMPREVPDTRVEANTAAGQVDLFRDGKPVMVMLAAAGKPGDETPMLVSAIDRVVLNPTWNVPEGIAAEEILPKGDGYLQRMGFTTGEGGRLIQQPGPQNALGQVKFLFDNPYAVYLHDTPAKAAFAREQRAVSHGCVRLARALDLAQALLATEAGWSSERINAVLASGETTEVKLATPVPVFLNYLTAYPTPVGMAFRPDVYGWDSEVLRRLDAAGPHAA